MADWLIFIFWPGMFTADLHVTHGTEAQCRYLINQPAIVSCVGPDGNHLSSPKFCEAKGMVQIDGGCTNGS